MTLFPEVTEIFGRGPDMDYLRKRVQNRGLTVVSGRPKLGKTWLVKNLCNELSSDGDWIVGYYRSRATNEHSLSFVIQSAFENWLSDASLAKKAKGYIDRNKTELRGEVGNFVKGLVVDAAKGAPFVGAALSNAIGKLTRVHTGMQESTIQLPPVPYEIARDLVTSISRVSEKRIVLVLDAWEQCQTLDSDYVSLSEYLENPHDWPESVHVVIVIRDEPKFGHVLEQASNLCNNSVLAQPYELQPMHLDDDAGDTASMVAFVRKEIPGASGEEDGWIIGEVGGNPGVLGDWKLAQPDSGSEMSRIAADVQTLRYRELESILSELVGGDASQSLLFDVAARLALIQELNSSKEWNALSAIVLDGSPADGLATLESMRLLDSSDPPSFGHTTRYEAMRRLISENAQLAPFTRLATEALIRACAARVDSTEISARPFAGALNAAHPVAESVGVSERSLWPTLAALSLFRVKLSSEDSELLQRSARPSATEYPELAPIASISLLNTLNHAKEDDDLTRRDALLDELRALHHEYPDDAEVRENLSIGLFNTLNYVKEEDDLPRRDALLDEIKALQGEFPNDAAVREQLARGLFNTLNDTKEEDNLPRRDALLDELKAFHGEFPDDAAVREPLAMGLLNTLVDAKEENDLTRRDVLLDELRALKKEFPDDAAVRERLAKGLFSTLKHAQEEKDLPRRDALLDELRALKTEFPDDAEVRKHLAMGLYNTLNHAKGQDADRADQLLIEIREFIDRYPDDPISGEIASRLSTPEEE